MILDDLLSNIAVVSKTGGAQVNVTGVQYNSRAVEPGSAFVAIRGGRTNGNRFVGEAIERGAAAIISETPPPTANRGPAASIPAPAASVPWIQVDSDRGALAALAANFYGRPSEDLTLVGITGTNGKTTTAHLVASIVDSAGHEPLLLGTIGNRGPGIQSGSSLTTPESSDLEQLFRVAVDRGCRHAVMEVSSHSIELRRVEQLSFDIVAFTNLTPEHLDFHGDLAKYFSVKQKLFTGLLGDPPPVAVLNRDDPYFEVLRGSGNPRCLTFGMTPAADVHPVRFELLERGLVVELETPHGVIELTSQLIGRLNLYNIAAAVSIGIALDVAGSAIVDGVAGLPGVPGRFERVDCGQSFRVIVDYAHTADALEKVLSSTREITKGKVIVVFGAGGDRDPTKRKQMGSVVASHSDFAVLTSDNPRDEDPLEIIRMIEEGMPDGGASYASIPDRREAIRVAMERAREDDTVVLAGKGHESYQFVGDTQLPFDDRAVARELLDELNAR